MGRKFWVLLISICFLGAVAAGIAYAQQKKVGGGDITFTAKGSTGPVLFSHAKHQDVGKLKCTDCHTKIFPMKKQELKLTKADHGQNKACGVCHTGQKAFSMTTDADCSKCHKAA